MAEAIERIKTLIDQLENFENHETGDLDIDDVKKDLDYIYSLMQDDVTDHQPAFAVGEYYSLSDSLIAKVLKTSEGMCAIRVYDPSEDKFWNDHMAYRSLWGEARKPATAEQIATFKRAEHFASKGRKLDEFQVGDDTTCGIVMQVSKDWITTEEKDGASHDIHFNNIARGYITLIQTAEELQEK